MQEVASSSAACRTGREDHSGERGYSARSIQYHGIGPEFLRKEEVDWPAPRTFKKETTGEEKTVDVVATASTRHPSPDPERFSSWKRLWRATARVLQFIQLCRKKEKVHAAKNDPAWKMTTSKKTKTDGKVIRPSNVQDRRYIPLDAELLEQAEALLLKGSQERCFREDIKCVQQEKQPEGSSKLRKLDVVYEDGLLRLKGRIDAIQDIFIPGPLFITKFQSHIISSIDRLALNVLAQLSGRDRSHESRILSSVDALCRR
ncbi:hypothetical protein PYW07_008891 [Mythimna separata]|uniref:Uncharacterized protein n=1 Tax=Mythimna separata TaxID=271217 RepID=A0AAD7YB51_MYTSE|nr:hypothetical protein PYW07_008891 [Mythimna separata]